VDASAAFEFLALTDAGGRAERLLRGAALVAAPQLLDVEVLSAVRRLTRRRELEVGDAEAVLYRLRAWTLRRLHIGPLIGVAWAMRANVSAYDALYVAAARKLRAAILSADGPLTRAPGLGVDVIDVSGRA
jgi:predicted nucleic acid-binding protein